MQAGKEKSDGGAIGRHEVFASFEIRVYYGFAFLLPPSRGFLEQDGFVQVYRAKIQAHLAKMTVMMLCISSGEDGFGPNPTKIQFIGDTL